MGKIDYEAPKLIDLKDSLKEILDNADWGETYLCW